MAVPLGQALQAMAHEKADTLLIDMAGPVPYALTGGALRAVASGRAGADPMADPAVREALRAAAGTAPEVVRAHLVPSADADGTLGLVLEAGADVALVAQRVSATLAADEVLRGALVRGIELALLPADTRLPGEPLYTR